MTRLMVWLSCSVIILASGLFSDRPFETGITLTMIGYLGAPLALHWAFERKKNPQ